MSIVDLIIVAAVALSMVVGFFRGFIKEAVSVLALLVAAWAALRFAPLGSDLIANVVGFGALDQSVALKMWLGRALIFFAVLLLGGLVGWALSYVINQTGMTGTDRILGMGFGFFRGALLLGVVALAGSYLGFSADAWWQNSKLVPYAERVGNGIKILAPKALEYLRPPDDETAPEIESTEPPVEAPVEA
ncbi:MAG: CvpA family protein [Pseudomonadota bacterium]